MLVINANNIRLVEQLTSVEIACRMLPQVTIDLPHNDILNMLETKQLSRETVLSCVRDLKHDLLGDIEQMSVLERLASVTNPAYAKDWYSRRNEWPRLLYASPDNPQILQRVLSSLSPSDVLSLDLPTAQYLSAEVLWAEHAVLAHETTEKFKRPTFNPVSPALSYWRATITRPILDTLKERTGWEYFDTKSPECIYTHTTDSETKLMLLANELPLSVIISRGRWTDANIEDILRKINASEYRCGLMLVLYERIARLWGSDSKLTLDIKSKLEYAKLFTADKMLRYHSKEWHPSTPAIHHYILDATEAELAHLIDVNFHADVGIFDAVDVCTPTALRRLMIAALRWVMLYKPNHHATVRNVLSIIAHYTCNVSWDTDDAAECHTALINHHDKGLLLMFILMETYPVGYKEMYAGYTV